MEEPKAAQTPLSDLVLFQKGFYGGKIKRCLIEYDDGSSSNIPANVMEEACRRIAVHPEMLEALDYLQQAFDGTQTMAVARIKLRMALAKATQDSLSRKGGE